MMNLIWIFCNKASQHSMHKEELIAGGENDERQKCNLKAHTTCFEAIKTPVSKVVQFNVKLILK